MAENMEEPTRRRPTDLLSSIGLTVLPLAAAGDPTAGQVLRCLTCEDASQRCGDCWARVRLYGAAGGAGAPK